MRVQDTRPPSARPPARPSGRLAGRPAGRPARHFFFKGTPRNTYSPAHFLCVRKARDLERAGAFCVVVECVPSVVGRAITEALQVPTVGIGAGPWMAGQVLVFHDLVGMSFHSDQHEAFAPRFCKRYASVGDEIVLGLRDFVREVKSFFCSIR